MHTEKLLDAGKFVSYSNKDKSEIPHVLPLRVVGFLFFFLPSPCKGTCVVPLQHNVVLWRDWLLALRYSHEAYSKIRHFGSLKKCGVEVLRSAVNHLIRGTWEGKEKGKIEWFIASVLLNDAQRLIFFILMCTSICVMETK